VPYDLGPGHLIGHGRRTQARSRRLSSRLTPCGDLLSIERRRSPVIRAPRAALVAIAALFVFAARGEPCSICRCGDPTFNALGKEGYAARGFRFALDWERFDKSEGPPEEEGEELVENRLTALVAYGFSEQLALYARVPVSFRQFQQFEAGSVSDAYATRGLSDPEVYGQARLWASTLSPTVGRQTSIAVLGGVKTALGNNDYEVDGERADEHAQPGTGSTDVFGELALLHLINPHSSLFASFQYRHTGTNSYGYRYGRSWLGNLAYEHKLTKRLDSVAELNFRQAAEDVAGAEGEDPNTGGAVLYFTPRLLFDLGRGFVLRAAAQIPFVKHLNGVQQERAVVNVGISFVPGH
jgi:hypothetical protein